MNLLTLLVDDFAWFSRRLGVNMHGCLCQQCLVGFRLFSYTNVTYVMTTATVPDAVEKTDALYCMHS